MKRSLVALVSLGIVLWHQGISLASAVGRDGQRPARSGTTRSERAGASVALGDELDTSSSELRPLIERFTVDLGGVNRFYTIPISPTRRERLRRFYTEWLQKLDGVNFEALSMEGRVDYLLFKNHLEYSLRQLDIQDKQIAEMEPLMPFAGTIIELEESRRRMESVQPQRVAERLTAMRTQIEQVRRAVEAGLRGERAEGQPRDRGASAVAPLRTTRTVANRALQALQNLRTTLRNWFAFYNGYDPLFTWWVSEPYQSADQALGSYMDFLAQRVVGVRMDEVPAMFGGSPSEAGRGAGGPVGQRPQPGAVRAPSPRPGEASDIIGDPIGRDALLVELAREMIPYTPEELIAIAEKEMAWCENEMKKAARELGFGDDWKRALEYVKTRYVDPGKQPDLVRDLAREAIAFLEERDLVTIPPLAKEIWRMEMMSPERQLVNPFFTGGEVITVSYPTNTMPHEAKMMSMRGNNIHFSRATVFHELIPGHHLQGFMTARYKPYRTLFSTPFWGEGWALYWELLLWDLGFHKSPEDRIGALFWRMHRCARVIFSLKFHLGEMTPEECIAYLVERVGHERANAEAEVRRSFGGQYGPLYQAAYLLGGLQFRALHRELVESGRMSDRAFHDAILREGRIPVEMVRAILTRQSLARDFRSSWRFYDLERR
jgi:uncharacterized protein (DUF885 family)